MLDVHAPEKPLRGVSDFLLHLFTISVGLLIATQIESCVEWRHHVHLVQEARESLRTEIEKNLKELKGAQPGLKKWRKDVDDNLAAAQRIQEHPDDPAAQHASFSINSSAESYADAAFRTAQMTGALGYMPYEEASRYAEIYDAQATLTAMEAKTLEDTADLFGLVSKYNLRTSKKITAEQASSLAEKFGQLKVHLVTSDLFLQDAIELDDAFLANRKPRHNFNEDLH